MIEGYTPYENIDELLDPAGVGTDKSKWGIVTRLMNLDVLFDGNSPFKLFQKERIEHFKLENDVVDIKDSQMPLGIGIQTVKLRVAGEDEKSDTGSTDRRSARGGRVKGAVGSDKVVNETVLIDPMTKEEISKTFDLRDNGRKKYDAFGEPVYITRDKWFRIKFKLLWKDAPKAEQVDIVDRSKKKSRKRIGKRGK